MATELERIAVAQKAKSSDIPLETFSTVVEAVYDCALDPNRWPNAISLISELLLSQRCALAVHNHADHIVQALRLDPFLIVSAFDHFVVVDKHGSCRHSSHREH